MASADISPERLRLESAPVSDLRRGRPRSRSAAEADNVADKAAKEPQQRPGLPSTEYTPSGTNGTRAYRFLQDAI